MLEQANQWETWNARLGIPNKHVWHQLKIIVQSLHDMGLIPDTDKFYFCYLDLYLRNMLVQFGLDPELKITGVIDWDARLAHFCPKFVAYRAPFWL